MHEWCRRCCHPRIFEARIFKHRYWSSLKLESSTIVVAISKLLSLPLSCLIGDGGSRFDWVFMGFCWGGLWPWRSVWLWKSVWPWVLDCGFWIRVYRFHWRWLGFSGFLWGWVVCNGGGDRCGCGEDGFLPCRIGKNKKMYVYWVFCVCFPRKFIGLWVCWRLVCLLGLWVWFAREFGVDCVRIWGRTWRIQWSWFVVDLTVLGLMIFEVLNLGFFLLLSFMS